MNHQGPAPRRFQFWTDVSALLTVAACYGTLAVVSLLPLLGIRFALDPGAWASAIVGFALLTLLLLALSYRRHHSPGPLILGSVAVALIIWVMFGNFNRILELAGFAALVTGVIWNRRITTNDPSRRRTGSASITGGNR